MKYWLTTQWPPGDCTSVWLKDRFWRYARQLEVGDLVVVYEAETAPGFTEEDGTIHAPFAGGRAGVICYGKVVEEFAESGNRPFTYDDGTIRLWQWYARLEPIDDGFVSHAEVCRIVGLPDLWRIGGGSGLRQITKGQFRQIQRRL